MSEIVSRHNPKFKIWLSLLEAQGIKKAGQALLSGRKLVDEFLDQNPDAAVELLFTSHIPAYARSHILSAELFKELDVLGTKAPLAVVQTPKLETWNGGPPHGLELIVPASDPANLGAILRSAEAFGVHRVILTREASSAFLPKALRASSGAALRVRLAQTGPLNQVTAVPGYCLDMQGEDLGQFPWPKDLYLILGEEGRGIPPSLTAKPLAIPMAEGLESLNVMAAASIALFSYRNRWPLKSP